MLRRHGCRAHYTPRPLKTASKFTDGGMSPLAMRSAAEQAQEAVDIARPPCLTTTRGSCGKGVRYATPMFVVLMLVEATDLIFAVDSIPAIFAVTNDPFIVFTSNIFAILGLRAMYFLLADMAERFHLLKYGLAIILIFIGIKMLLLDIYKIPVSVALGIVGLILVASIAASFLTSRQNGRSNSGA